MTICKFCFKLIQIAIGDRILSQITILNGSDDVMSNFEVYATVTIFVKDAKQLFHKLISGVSLQIKDDFSQKLFD